MSFREANPPAYRNLQILENLFRMIPSNHRDYEVARNSTSFRVIEEIFRITGKDSLAESLNAMRLKEPNAEEATKQVLLNYNKQQASAPPRAPGEQRGGRDTKKGGSWRNRFNKNKDAKDKKSDKTGK
jgi:hypothetical protein